MQRHCRIEIAGRLPTGLRDELDRRFGPTVVHERTGTTALVGLRLDQAGLRALLDLLWDAGVEVSAVHSADAASDPVVRPPADGTGTGAPAPRAT